MSFCRMRAPFLSLLILFGFLALTWAIKVPPPPSLCVKGTNPFAPRAVHSYISSHPEDDPIMLGLGCCLESTTPLKLRQQPGVVINYKFWLCPDNVTVPSDVSNAGQKRAALRQQPPPERNRQVASQFIAWDLDAINQRGGPLDNNCAPRPLASPGQQQHVDVYVVDTGIQPSLAVFQQVTISLDYPSVSGAIDHNGHGSFVASEIAGISVGVLDSNCQPGVESTSNIVIHAVAVLDAAGHGTIQDLVNGLSWIQNNANPGDLISMSLAADGISSQLDSFIATMHQDSGFIFIVAGGNYADSACNYSPAAGSPAHTNAIGAIQLGYAAASYSNYGPCIVLWAPGTDVWGGDLQSPSSITQLSGTSMATPLVTGAIARCRLEDTAGTKTNAQCLSQVLADATPNILTGIGLGAPNIFLYVGSASPSPSPPPPSPPSPPPPSSSPSPPPPPPPPSPPGPASPVSQPPSPVPAPPTGPATHPEQMPSDAETRTPNPATTLAFLVSLLFFLWL